MILPRRLLLSWALNNSLKFAQYNNKNIAKLECLVQFFKTPEPRS
jgi:hypothetical protein